MPKVSPTLGRQLIDENRADVIATGEPKPHLSHKPEPSLRIARYKAKWIASEYAVIREKRGSTRELAHDGAFSSMNRYGLIGQISSNGS